MTPEVILASLLLSMTQLHSSEQLNAIDVQHRLERLLVIGRVLYIAAHPDDENTQLLTYLTHARRTRTAYLSLTRGDGGQNLIGSEQSPLMGVIRTHELLAARQIDGAEQMFTRARDFSYAKRADESVITWGHQDTVGDMVWAIRRFRPHLVITRFPESGNTHGHHLASAILAREAFAAAGDSGQFAEQLERVEAWQPQRLVFNVPNRFMPEEERPDDLVVDIGGYDPASGLSYGEIAAASRSMHKSQGFGAARRFGPEPERFRHLAGEPAKDDLLEGIPLSWSSVEGGAAVAAALETAKAGYRPNEPGAIAGALAEALKAAAEVSEPGLRSWAQREIGALLVAVSGLLIEARSEVDAVTPGSDLAVKVLVLRRGPVAVHWHEVSVGGVTTNMDRSVADNTPVEQAVTVTVDAQAPLSTLPWLDKPPGPGRYRGTGDPDVPLPEPQVQAKLVLTIAGVGVEVAVPVQHYWTDRVEGELRREVEVLPPITATPAAKAAFVPCSDDGCETQIRVRVHARSPGTLRVEPPQGFTVSPPSLEVSEDVEAMFTITATPGATPGTARFVAEVDGRKSSLAEHPIKHRHVPARTVLLPAELALTTASLEMPQVEVGHIAGPGDDVAHGLRRVGFRIEDVDDDTLAHGELDRFGAILVGVRAFNTNEVLRAHHQRLFAFAERGGTVVVQYATKPRRDPLDVPLLPYEMDLGRGRVTDEAAVVDILTPEHPLLSTPNTIGAADFAGWVHERGLYFGATWDEQHVTPLLSMADEGGEPEKGSLLVADHGDGRVVYVGLSLFRQIPAGVPGAYRLMANLLSRRDAGPTADEPPPVLGRWRNFYIVVLVILMVLIGSFYLLTRRYST